MYRNSSIEMRAIFEKYFNFDIIIPLRKQTKIKLIVIQLSINLASLNAYLKIFLSRVIEYKIPLI